MRQLIPVAEALCGACGVADYVEMIRIIISPRCGLPD